MWSMHKGTFFHFWGARVDRPVILEFFTVDVSTPVVRSDGGSAQQDAMFKIWAIDSNIYTSYKKPWLDTRAWVDRGFEIAFSAMWHVSAIN